MTEKEFKKIIIDYEMTSDNKMLYNNLIIDMEQVIKDNLSKNISFNNLMITGLYANSITNNLEKEFSLCVVLNSNISNESFGKRIILNEIESVLLLNYQNLNIVTIDKNQLNNLLKVKLSNGLMFNIKVLSTGDEQKINDEMNKIKIIEIINQKFTFYKNTLSLIKYYKLSENLLEIDDYIISIILAYALEKYPTDNKYYKYLNSFVKGLDDFLNSKKITLLNNYIMDAKDHIINNKYNIINPVNYEENLAVGITENILSDYRKLRKKISKELESSIDLGYTFDNSTEVVIDIEPLEKDQTYAWRFEIIGKDLKNQNNEYLGGIENYHSALLKGAFKGLKSLIQNGLIKKKIYLTSSFGDIFKTEILSNDENKSRIKTIKSLIEQNKLNIICITREKE